MIFRYICITLTLLFDRIICSILPISMSQITEIQRLVGAYLQFHSPLTVKEIADALSFRVIDVRIALFSLRTKGSVKREKGRPVRYASPHAITGGGFDEEHIDPQTSHPASEGDDSNQSSSDDEMGFFNYKHIDKIDLDARRINMVFPGQKTLSISTVQRDTLAFISAMDAVCSSDLDYVPMLGIFGAWGRGKTYFFKLVKSKLSIRPKSKIHYDLIEFNAWKYQTVPAIWASLFETVYHYKPRLFRAWFWVLQNYISILKDLLLFFSLPLFIWIITKIPVFSSWNRGADIARWSVFISVLGFFIDLFFKQRDTLESIFSKYSKGVSFTEHLGIQAEIERTLAAFLKAWIRDNNVKNQKVLLYIEDIDRCDNVKMLGIIESLRTVLDHPDIRKRLLVIVSMDSEKLWNALKEKYQALYSEKQLREILIAHFDKLFVGGISLPAINDEESQEYLALLGIGYHLSPDPFDQLNQLLNQELFSFLSKKDKEKIPRLQDIDNKSSYDDHTSFRMVLDLIGNSLSQFADFHPTPRQLNCLIFRTLLAIQLIQEQKRTALEAIDHTFVDQIIARSYMSDRPEYLKSIRYDREIEMVIPYPSF